MEDLRQRVNGLADAVEGVLQEIREKFREAGKHAGVWESLQQFSAAVDWKEPWIIGLLVFQALFLTAAIAFRKSNLVSGLLFGFGALVVFNAERLNSVAARHHKMFTSQPYFDPHGIFFSALVSAPLLFTMFVLLVNYLFAVSDLLIKTKRKELRYKARQRAREEQSISSSQETRKER